MSKPRFDDLPQHVAIIMDGNGRWACDHGLPRLEGHRRGADVVREITTFARELGIGFLTLYSFSRQNWRRPALEVAGLMALLEDFCGHERQTLMQHEIRLTTIGDISRLPHSTRTALTRLMQQTASNQQMTLCLAIDYGGREEILAAVNKLAADVAHGLRGSAAIDEGTFSEALQTHALPDPDLLIRTSGEQRISNFLLWQLAYAELHFSEARWPEFTRQHFTQALHDYARRERRFGGTGLHAAAQGV